MKGRRRRAPGRNRSHQINALLSILQADANLVQSDLDTVFHEFAKERHVFLNVFHENIDGKHVCMEDAHAVHVFMEDVEEDVPFLL